MAETPEIRKIKEGSFLLYRAEKFSYYWTQSLKDAQVCIEIPGELKSKQIKVTFGSKRIVFHQGGEVLFDGQLLHPILADECTWFIDREFSHPSIEKPSVCVCILELVKANQSSWWDGVFEGHDKIDTKEFEPKTSNLSDIDDQETRANVEKMMVDMFAARKNK